MTSARLDPEATPAGLRERLFLHETLTPAYPDYATVGPRQMKVARKAVKAVGGITCQAWYGWGH